jgi:small subunit ribosomal protein S21
MTAAQVLCTRAAPDPRTQVTQTIWGRILQVFVRDNNVDQALKVLKRKMQREGVFREMRRRRFYEKPSERLAREKSEGIRRIRKLKRKQAQREGLIAAPRKKEPATKKTIRHRSTTIQR